MLFAEWWGDVGTWAGAIATIGAAVAAWVIADRTLRISRIANRLSYFTSLRNWADEVIAHNETAVHLCEVDPTRIEDPSYYNRRYDLMCKFAALLDRGRLFFPNLHQEQHGGDKHPAFRGYRREALDSVFLSYLLVRSLNYQDCSQNQGIKQEFVDNERAFVSQIQEILRPGEAAKEFALLTKPEGGANP